VRRISALPAAAAVLALTAGTVLLAAPSASADGLPMPTLSKTTVKPGETFTVSGSGCTASQLGYEPQVYVNLTESVDVTVSADGTWSVTTTLNPDLRGGRYTYHVDATCSSGPAASQPYPPAPITIDAPPYDWQVCTTYAPGVLRCPPGANPDAAPAPGQTSAPHTTAVPPAPRRSVPALPTPSTPSPTPTPLPATSAGSTTSGGDVAPTPAAGCPDCALLTGDRPVTAGARLALSYAGFQPGERVRVVLHSTPVRLGTFVADATGIVTAPVAVPATLEAGAHTLTLTGERTGDRVVHFRLSRAATARAAHEESGTSIALPLVGAAAGAVLLLAGGGALVVRRRRAAAIG
jgi:hypothetical protein